MNGVGLQILQILARTPVPQLLRPQVTHLTGARFRENETGPPHPTQQ